MKSYEFELGECSERYPWKILFNYVSTILDTEHECEKLPCKHAKFTGKCEDGINIPSGKKYGVHKEYSIPKVIVCENEGGNNVTILCVECFDEARASIKEAA